MNLADHLPALIIALPLMVAFVMPLLKRVGRRGKGVLMVAVALALLGMVLALAFQVYTSEARRVDYTFGQAEPAALQNVTGLQAEDRFPVRILFQVDAFSIFMASITATVTLAGVIYSQAAIKEAGRLGHYYALLLLMAVGMYGMEFTGDLFNLFVFLEITSVAACAMVAFHRRSGLAVEAALKYLVLSTLGGLLILLGVALLYAQYNALNLRYVAQLMAARGVGNLERMALVLFVTSFAMKAGAVPMHMWTMDAYMEAPHSVMPMLVSVSQASLYATFRVVFTLYNPSYLKGGIDPEIVGQVLIGLGLLSMFVGVTMALVQTDIKRLMAYHAVSQTGYMFLGVGVGLAVLNTPAFQAYGAKAMAGGIFHILNHALYKGLLFLTAGAVIHRVGTRNLNKMGGLAHNMALTTVFFMVGAAAITGLPPFNGYASKVLIYETVYRYNPLLTVVALLVSVLTLASFVKVFYSAFLGPPREATAEKVKEVPRPMLAGMALLATLTILLGLFPGPFVAGVVDPAVEGLAGSGGFEAVAVEDQTLETGHGVWSPLWMLAGLALVAPVIGLLLWLGVKGRRAGGRKGEPFLSGNPLEEQMRVSGVYWGFVEALHDYYRRLKLVHSGDLRDYLFWYLTVAVVLAVIFVGVAS